LKFDAVIEGSLPKGAFTQVSSFFAAAGRFTQGIYENECPLSKHWGRNASYFRAAALERWRLFWPNPGVCDQHIDFQ
jgi:hypothetical protein